MWPVTSHQFNHSLQFGDVMAVKVINRRSLTRSHHAKLNVGSWTLISRGNFKQHYTLQLLNLSDFSLWLFEKPEVIWIRIPLTTHWEKCIFSWILDLWTPAPLVSSVVLSYSFPSSSLLSSCLSLASLLFSRLSPSPLVSSFLFSSPLLSHPISSSLLSPSPLLHSPLPSSFTLSCHPPIPPSYQRRQIFLVLHSHRNSKLQSLGYIPRGRFWARKRYCAKNQDHYSFRYWNQKD